MHRTDRFSVKSRIAHLIQPELLCNVVNFKWTLKILKDFHEKKKKQQHHHEQSTRANIMPENLDEHNHFSLLFDQSANRQQIPTTKTRKATKKECWEKRNEMWTFHVLKRNRGTLNVISCLGLIINCWPLKINDMKFFYQNFIHFADSDTKTDQRWRQRRKDREKEEKKKFQ